MTVPAVAITLDIDWAPDHVIDEVAALLVDHGVHATWFVTHHSPAVDRLRRHDALFELGVHPNLLPGSSHGATSGEVLAHIMAIVPEARAMRTHSLAQSTPFFTQVLAETPITCDVSTYLPHHRGLLPTRFRMNGRTLVRLPFCWEDDLEMEYEVPLWDPWPLVDGTTLAVLDFHPIHLALNSGSMGPYRALKQQHPRLADAPSDAIRALTNAAAGSRSALLALIRRCAAGAARSVRVSDIAA